MFFKNPLLSISLSLSLFSFAGVPPLIGFFAKQQVLYTATSAGFYFLSIIAIIVSVISASYYLKIIKIITTPSTPSTLTIEEIVKRSPSEPAVIIKKTLPNLNKIFIDELTNILVTVYDSKKNPHLQNGYSLKIFNQPHIALSNLHCFLIGIITMSLILFIFNPEIIFKTIAIITSFILNIKNE